MKKTILGLALSLPMLALAQQADFTINGKIADVKSGMLYYQYRNGAEGVRDSVMLNNGAYSIKGSVNGPTQIGLMLKPNAPTAEPDSYTLYVDKGETVLTAKDKLKSSTLKGSALSQDFVKYNALLEPSNVGMAQLDKEWAAATDEQRKEGTLMKNLRARVKPIMEEKERVQKAYLKDNPNSYFALVALQDIAGSSMDVTVIEPAYKSLTDQVKNSTAGIAFAKRIETAKLTAVGAMAPDFTQNDVNDKPVKLSDFRGKYVLLDFWASWCGPCRAENPNVVEAFHKFKDRNFTVLGVSLDNPGKKDNWLKAIADDKLDWTQVSDLQGWKNAASTLYGVRGIPQNYLIGPDGKILASNLRGEELHKKLEELLK